jgi:NADH:ubiquinone oxidoreductase subunit H
LVNGAGEIHLHRSHVITISLVVALYMTYGERKVAAWIQDRVGPNSAGPFGILQPLADGVKMFFKEEIIPTIPISFVHSWPFVANDHSDVNQCRDSMG